MKRTTWLIAAVCCAILIVVSRLNAQQEASETNADIVLDCKITAVRRFLETNNINVGNLLSFEQTTDSSPIKLAGLKNAEHIYLGVRLGVLQGRSNVFHSVISFADPMALSMAIDLNSHDLDANGRLVLPSTDGIGPITLSQKSPQSLTIESIGDQQTDLRSFFRGIDTKIWRDNENAKLRIALELHSLSPLFIALTQNNFEDLNLNRALTETLEICDRLQVLVGGEEYAVRIYMEPTDSSSVRRLKQRVSGLIYLLQNSAQDYMESSGTGDEDLDNAVVATIEDIEPVVHNEYVMITINHSVAIDGLVSWVGRLVNKSKVAEVEETSP